MEIYDDSVSVEIRGNEIKVGGALITVMSRNPYVYELISNAVAATERQHSRQPLMAMNLN